MGNESITHLRLKQFAKTILLKKGFKEKEIFIEYRISITKKEVYYVDIVGISNKNKVFIECGRVSNPNKLKVLKELCNEMIWLPYIPGAVTGKAMGSRIKIYDLVEALEKQKKRTNLMSA